jgi:hypothetical protein
MTFIMLVSGLIVVPELAAKYTVGVLSIWRRSMA